MIEAKILFTFGFIGLIISTIVLIKCLKSRVLSDYLTKLQEDLKIYVAGEYITPTLIFTSWDTDFIHVEYEHSKIKTKCVYRLSLTYINLLNGIQYKNAVEETKKYAIEFMRNQYKIQRGWEND